MNKTTLLYAAALLYGCVLDVYAASIVRLLSEAERVDVTTRWLKFWKIPRVIERWSWGREHLNVLRSRTVCFPVVELFTGLCIAAVVVYRGANVDSLALTVLLSTVVIGAATDIELLIYPDRLSWPLFCAGLVFGVLEWPIAGFATTLDRIGGGALGFGLIGGAKELYYRIRGTEGLGSGDVKMCTAIGLFVGIKGCFFFVLAWTLFGSLTGLLLIVTRRIRLSAELPTGGWYAFGLACVLLFPPNQYLDKTAQPYTNSQLARETLGRSMNRDSFGAGVRDAR